MKRPGENIFHTSLQTYEVEFSSDFIIHGMSLALREKAKDFLERILPLLIKFKFTQEKILNIYKITC